MKQVAIEKLDYVPVTKVTRAKLDYVPVADLCEEMLGYRPSKGTIWRWKTTGILRTVKVRNKVCTTPQWLVDMVERDPSPQQASSDKPRSEASIARAEVATDREWEKELI